MLGAAVAVANQRHIDVNPNGGAVARQIALFKSEGFFAGDQRIHHAGARSPVIGMSHLVEGFAFQLGARELQ